MKKTCYICGKEYIVSIKNTADPYIAHPATPNGGVSRGMRWRKRKMPADITVSASEKKEKFTKITTIIVPHQGGKINDFV